MPKAMILDSELTDVIALENKLVSAGYDVCTLTGPYGVLAKIDYEKPDILLFNPNMVSLDADALLLTISASNHRKRMVIVLIGTGDAKALEEYCRSMKLHGFFLKGNGFIGIVDYLQHFYD